MKYADLYQLGKEKLKIKRRVPKVYDLLTETVVKMVFSNTIVSIFQEKLVEALLKMHQDLLSDTNFVSDDSQLTEESEPTAPIKEPEQPAAKRGRKRGKKSREDEPDIKKSKQDLTVEKDAAEPEIQDKLNSTFTKENDADEMPAPKEAPEAKELSPKTPIRKALRRTTSSAAPRTPSNRSALKKTLSSIEAPSTPVNKKEPEEGKATRMSMSQPRPVRPVVLIPSTPASARKAVQFTSSSAKKPTTLTKPRAAPNFAEIHQKNFDKMQSVDEYVEKKKARTEALKATGATTPAPAPVAPVAKKTSVARSFNFVSGESHLLLS